MKNIKFLCLLLFLIVAQGASQTQGRVVPDLILLNGKIVTVDANFTVASAVAIKDGKILAVGKTAEIATLAGDSTEKIDLGGKTVIPGLMDNHTHATLGAFCEGPDAPELNILKLDSVNDVLEALKKKVAQAKPGEWIITTCMWRGNMREGRLPTRDDLDPFSPNNPVFLRRGGSNFILNTAALRLLGVDENTTLPKVEGKSGGILRDANGRFTGQLMNAGWDEMMGRVRAVQGGDIDEYFILKSYPIEERVKRLKYLMAEYNQAGVTSIRDMSVSRRDLLAYEQLWKNHELTVRVNAVWAPLGNTLSKEELIRQIREEWGPKLGFGDEWLRIGGMKIHNWGLENVRAGILEANRWGWTLAIHYQGGVGVKYLVDVLEEADKENPIAGRRFTLEHDFGPEAKDSAFLAKLKRLGLIMAPQPERIFHGPRQDVGGPVDLNTVPETYIPIGNWIKAGLVVTGGTDHPASFYDTERPLKGLYAAITRKHESGRMLGASQGVTREEALRMYTMNGAYSTFEENIKGSIEPGKVADLVVLSDDYLQVSEDKILNIKVVRTIVGGKTVYIAPH